MDKKRYLEIGQIVSTHGLKGDVRVDPWCDGPEFLCAFRTLYKKDGTPIKIKRAFVQKNVAVMKLEGVDSIEQADLLRKTVLYMDRNDVTLDEGVFFVQDILGCEVHDADTDVKYGKVTDILKTGANDVYQVTDDSGKNVLIPVIDDVVKETDIDKGIIKITPIKGLFDDED